MQNLSLMQALSLWSELEQAYYGDNGFGGNTAEIYAYTLLQSIPSQHLNEGNETDAGQQAATSLLQVLELFSKLRKCEITIEGCPYHDFLSKPLIHRCHVRVVRT